MHTWDIIGYVASTLVLTAFGMKNIIPLRVVAMCSNLVFMIYGLGLGLTPVWSLHAALLPMNAWRLIEALGGAQVVGAHVLRLPRAGARLGAGSSPVKDVKAKALKTTHHFLMVGDLVARDHSHECPLGLRRFSGELAARHVD